MTGLISFARPDGATVPAYLAEPEHRTESSPSSSPRGGVVVLQEWWGLNPQIRTVADRLAAAGYRALVPDLYRGQLAQTAAEAQQLMGSLNREEVVQQDIAGAIQYLKTSVPKVAVIGFCLGGALTLAAASAQLEFEAAVCFYGIPPLDEVDPGQIRMPLQAHFANQDDWCNPTLVDQLEERLRQGQVPFTLYRYEAQHAFMNDTRPEVYDAAAATLAWERLLSFLDTQLSGLPPVQSNSQSPA
ncbi:MAG: dienelactone hydrolase family protein [Thermostichus sp. DG_1_6_bins_120]